MTNSSFLLMVMLLAGITAFVLLAAVGAKYLHRYREYCKGRFESRLARYLTATEGKPELGKVRFTTYAGFINWADQYTWTIPVREGCTEEALALLRDLASMSYKYAFLGYGLFIPLLVWLDKYRKSRRIKRLAKKSI